MAKVKPFIIITAKLDLTQVQKKGAVKALDAIEDLFGPKGAYWVKGDYSTEVFTDRLGNGLDDAMNAFCLSGAAAEANGKYEPIARAAITLAINKLFPQFIDQETFPLEISRGESSEDGCGDGTDESIIRFNDNNKTSWEQVTRVMKEARKLVEKA